MFLRLKNAAATFQLAMHVILSNVKWQYAFIYLDDIVLFSKKLKVHTERKRSVFCLLEDAAITLKLKKYAFPATK